MTAPPPAVSTPVLYAFEGVTVEGDGRARIFDLYATVPPRGITVVAGPSGAGKTTLLRLCNRLEVPTRGTVQFRGTDVAGMDPLALRRRAGMVFQRPTLFGGTVRDNLLVAAPTAARDELVEALHQAALDASFLDRPADRLSGGEAQRVCLARTLVTGPEVLLLDEPTSSLDRAPEAAFEGLARRLAGAGMPIVWVTHDLGQLRRLADQVLVLAAGRLEAAGPPGDVAAPFLREEQ